MSEEVIVDMRVVFCAVSLLALNEATPMYQHMTEVTKESCSKKGELGRLRTVMSDAVTVDTRCRLFSVSWLALNILDLEGELMVLSLTSLCSGYA